MELKKLSSTKTDISRARVYKFSEFIGEGLVDRTGESEEEIARRDIDTKYAVIKILKPLSWMNPKYYYQEVPLHQTQGDKITIKKGSSGTKTISRRNIEVIKVFSSNSDELRHYLDSLREADRIRIETKPREQTKEEQRNYL